MNTPHAAQLPDCRQVYPLLFEYLDQALSADRRATVEAHLAACLHCREVAGLQSRIRRLILGRGGNAAPSDFVIRLQARLAESREEGDAPPADPHDLLLVSGELSAAGTWPITEEEAASARREMLG